jgi:PAS domain S-box-containing protein
MTGSPDTVAALSNERRFQTLIDAVIDYAIFMLDAEGRVTSWNSGARRIKGYSADEIIGQHFSRFYTDEARAAGEPQQMLAAALEAGRHEKEGWRVRKDGSTFWAHVVIDCIRDESGHLIGFAKVTRDMTDRLKAQEALDKARAAFAQAQKMEAVGQLTGGVAHDFNNLLTVITNALDLLSRPRIEEQQRRRIIDTAQRAAARGAKLTQQLLAFSRRQPLRPEIHRVGDLIGGIEMMLRRACGELVELDIEASRQPIAAHVDAQQFEATLLNLAVNARDAMPRGGRLKIRTQVQEIDAARSLDMSGISPGHYAVVSVIDTGEGMPPDVQARAFEPFFTTKEVGKGSGLGLSQVYGFVTQSGGHVEISSEVGAGTTVTIYLPALADPIAAEAEAHVQEASAGTGAAAGTVLVVEDDEEVLEVAVETLRALGYEVLTASDGPSALSKLRRGSAVDILFTDVVMPKGMSGIELARRAREINPDVHILLASGYPMSALSSEHGLTDEFTFLSKPYRWSDLSERIRSIRGLPH